MDQDVLIIGSGQTGVRLAAIFRDKYQYPKENCLLFNTNNDDDVKNLVILHNRHGFDGSGRNPMFTLETIMPQNEPMLRETVPPKLKKNNKIILFNAVSGGSGSAINYWLLKEILIPYSKQQRKLDIVSVVVFPLKFEGNPAISNSLAMLNMYYSLSSYISILPVENQKVFYSAKGQNTFEATNDYLTEIVFKSVNHQYFLGTPKPDGIGTLDKKEVSRILEPANGFLGYAEVDPEKLSKIENPLADFDIRTCKKLIIMIRTPKNKSLDLELLNEFDRLFPEQVKIFSESYSEEDKITIDILANGMDVPPKYQEGITSTVEKIEHHKEVKKEAKKSNKETVRAAGKKLFKI